MQEQTPTFEELQASNAVLRSQLTNKNEQYLFQLEKTLAASNLSKESIAREFSQILPLLVENQKAGLTARQLLGTVTERAQAILAGPKKDPNAKSPDWQIAVDGGLLLGGMFALISGITVMMNPAKAMAMGLLTLLMNFILGGLVLLLLSKYAPDFSKPKGQRGYLKYLLISTLAMVVWLFFVMGGQAFLPAALNPGLPGWAYLLIGVLALVGKWYFKKTYQVTGTIM